MNGQAKRHLIGHVILTKVFSKVCVIDIFQRADNFFS